ncbi:MAG TPA: M1 family metallopeptidase [Ignavibacteriaceae bacterium]|nr:M1 family metallopeptidase [Ignavibacteriaceae bacterium]
MVNKNRLIYPVFLLLVLPFSECILKQCPILGSPKYKPGISAYLNVGDTSKDYISSNQYKIDVLSYILKIDLLPSEKLLRGDAEIKGVIIDKDINSIDLNFYDNLVINSASLNGKDIKYKRSATRISFPIDKVIPDTFKIEINYEGTPKKTGFASFVFGQINDISLVYNLNEPNFASTWFPCNDMPLDKALLDIFITNDSSETSVSNGKLIKIFTTGDRRTYHWKTYYPISTYLVSVYSSRYVEFDDKYISQDKADTMAIKYYVLPNKLEYAKKDFSDQVEMMNYFAKTFGEYPFIKEKYGIAEFLWQMGAMENQTITGIGSVFIGGRKFFNDIYSHELAHQWFGDAVGLKSWKDIWLNEGFASYCEALFVEHQSGKRALQSTMMNKFHDSFWGKIYDPDDLFSSTVYDKGAWVLHMLRWELGDAVFFMSMRNYFNKFKYKNASIEDFKLICENFSGKNLDKFFHQWIYEGTGILKVGYNWDIVENNKNYELNLKISQIQNQYNTYEFPLEIEILFEDSTSKFERIEIIERKQEYKLVFDKEPKSIILDPHNWLLGTFVSINNQD